MTRPLFSLMGKEADGEATLSFSASRLEKESCAETLITELLTDDV